MRKLSIYTFLAVAILFVGCSQKEVGLSDKEVGQAKVSGADEVQSSESALSSIDNSNIQDEASNDALVESGDKGYFYTIEGKKVFIENIYFDFDKYNLTSQAKEVTESNAMELKGIQPSTIIKVEGNCDEWGTDEYNYALGLKRAKVVKDALVMDGVPETAIKVVSFGESNPVCTDKNIACWKQNRRVEHKLIKQ